MDKITLVNKNKQLTLDSREVAEMVGKRHDHLIRDVEMYIEYMETPDLGNGSIPRVTDFFMQGFYLSGNPPREYKKYDCTKKGCEFIAHKLTGQKGALFTASYINRFHEMEEDLRQVSVMLTEEQKLQLAIFQARTVDEAAVAAANLDRYRQKQIEAKEREIEHKTEVIRGVTDDVDIYTKRNVLNKVVRYKNANFAERWNELYERYREVYSVDLKARCEGYNLKQQKKKNQLSVIKYTEKFGHIDNLYKIALKLYETDIKEILRHLQKIA